MMRRPLLVLALSVAIGTAHSAAAAACTPTDPDACFEAARGLAKGTTGERDLLRAARLFGMACDGGHPEGCYNAGLIHEIGEHGVDRDLKRAAGFYSRACEKDFLKGCTNAAQMYREGAGVKKDAKRAFALSDKASRPLWSAPTGSTTLGR